MAAYLNGRYEAERPHSPRENSVEQDEQGEQEFNYEGFRGTYPAKRLSASVTIKPGERFVSLFPNLTRQERDLMKELRSGGYIGMKAA
jgi:hypothetical protein